MGAFKKHTVELDEEKVALFREDHPQQGALKWFFDSCLSAYKKIRKNKEIAKLEEEAFNEAVNDATERMTEGGDVYGGN